MDVGSLRREIGQSRPFSSRRQEAALSLLKTADAVRRLIAGIVETEGVTPQQYNVLRILRGARPDGLPTLEIGRRMIEQAPGVTDRARQPASPAGSDPTNPNEEEKRT